MFAKTSYRQTQKWLRKLKGDTAEKLRSFLELEPLEQIVDLEDDVVIECVILNTENRITYLEYDRRLRPLVHLYKMDLIYFRRIARLMQYCDFFCRCVAVQSD